MLAKAAIKARQVRAALEKSEAGMLRQPESEAAADVVPVARLQ
jgi:hypothetical protein